MVLPGVSEEEEKERKCLPSMTRDLEVTKMDELKPCPFCGGKVSIVLCDDEGNLHDEAYREHPYSGLGFMLHHAHEENPGCPIASYECDGGILGGVYIYGTEEQAVEAWNRRVNDGKDDS